jgi:hypothetical protein
MTETLNGPVIYSGEVRIAMVWKRDIFLQPLEFAPFEEDEKVELTPEFVRLPIDPIDAEFFGDYVIYQQKLMKPLFDNPDKEILGFIHGGEFYMKNLSIRGDSFIIKRYLKEKKFVECWFPDEKFTRLVMHPEAIRLHREFHPMKFFLLQRLEILLTHRLFDPEILTNFCPISVQSEVDVICTKHGCVGIITKNGSVRFSGHRSGVIFGEIIGNVFLSECANLLLEERAPIDPADEKIINEYFCKDTSHLRNISHLRQISVMCTDSGHGTTGGFIIDFVNKELRFPKIFLKKGKIVPDCISSRYAVKVGHVTWENYFNPPNNALLSMFLRKINLRPSKLSAVKYKRFSYPENWGLFDRSLVLFPGELDTNVFSLDRKTGRWFRFRNQKVYYDVPSVCICLDLKEEIIDAIIGEKVPVDLGKLIVSFTYDHFAEELEGDDPFGYTNDDFDPINIDQKVRLAREIIQDRF